MSEAEITARLARGLERHRAGDPAAALAAYRAVLAEAPDHPDALALAGSALRAVGEGAAAIDHLARAAAVAPDRADIRYNLGNAFSAFGADRDAVTAFRAALERDPTHADAAANLGIALARLGDLDGAEAAYRAALAIDADHRIAGVNLGNLLGERGRTDEGLAALRAAVARRPDLAEAHYNLALLLLRCGDWTTGFSAYEWRWATADFASPARHRDLPDWDGRPLGHGRLLVHAEQGLGDTLQFARLLPLAASLAPRLTLEAPTVLVRLLQGIAGAEAVTDRVEPADFVAQTPLMGLPHRLGLTLGALPAPATSLAADPERVATWRERLALGAGEPVVAVAWRGNPHSPADRGRSLDGAVRLAPLAAPGRRLLAVQKLGREEIEPGPGPSGWRVAATGDVVIEHPGPEFDAGRDAFLDTAAVLTSADRVVTIDSAVAHLAAALGRPTAILLKAVADWRWLERRADTPWYRSVRLHRQTTPGDFSGPIASAAAELDATLGRCD